MLNLVRRSAAPSHEDVFLARYTALVIVALAFIRFTLVQPPLDEVQHLDAYLSRMLPNMYTRCSRRCGGTCGIPPNEYQLQRSGTHAGGMAGTGCLPARMTHPSVRFCAVRAFTTVGTAETLRGEPQAIRAQDTRRKRSA